jgi:hypothetical protein
MPTCYVFKCMAATTSPCHGLSAQMLQDEAKHLVNSCALKKKKQFYLGKMASPLPPYTRD